MKEQKQEKPTVTAPSDHELSQAEREEDLRIDTTFAELTKAVVRPIRVAAHGAPGTKKKKKAKI